MVERGPREAHVVSLEAMGRSGWAVVGRVPGIGRVGAVVPGEATANALRQHVLTQAFWPPISFSGRMVSADFDQGMSGGPTINSRGEVYGINSQMTVPFFGQNFNVITDTGMLREFLGAEVVEPKAASVPVEPPNQVVAAVEPGSSFSQGALTGWPLLISGFGGVALGGGLVAWRLKSSPRSGRSAKTTEASP
ncbi:hypothetical protein [Pseudonocardia kunmingensis]|uniref:Trypsin-like peptidase n=1 Tax=Pseudonocardia kunmingensis TaxID=630975 RepID=A0A543DVD6_9PSEU|nr:hypothetical protein [Pseudonocardia kunmingensis]TQM13276.1 hypothetical protein FB558_0006 [Pseudonocardia kunmingensis]